MEIAMKGIDEVFHLAALIARTENYIEDNYPNAYPARFFANPAKIQELYDNN